MPHIYSRQQRSQVEGYRPMQQCESRRSFWKRPDSRPYEGELLHQQRIFGALTPCCGAWVPGLCTITSSASGASRAPRRHRPRSLPLGRPNSSNCRRNCADFSRNYGASGALTPAFWDSGVRAPSVRTVAS